MSESTTIINNTNGDRVMRFYITNHTYTMFTVSHKNLIVVENSEDEAILLYNRAYSNRDSLDKAIDNLILMVTKIKDSDEFTSKMDTYINLNDSNIHNETTNEILGTYKFILTEFNYI